MGVGEVHPSVLVDHGSLQRLGQRDQPLHAFLVVGHQVGNDDRRFSFHQPAGRFGDGGLVPYRGLHRRHRQQFVSAIADLTLLQVPVDDHGHRPHRRCHGDSVGTGHGLREVLQGERRIVPLDVIAHHAHAVLGGMRPLHARASLGGVKMVAGEQDHRRAVAPGVVDRHGRMLQSHRAVAEHAQRPSGDLVIAMRHRGCLLFMNAGQQFRGLIAAIVDDGLVNAPEAGAGVGGDVVEAQALDHVHHEIRARIPDEILPCLIGAVAFWGIAFHRLLKGGGR